MAQVVLENVYKSFPARQRERAVVPVAAQPMLTPSDETILEKVTQVFTEQKSISCGALT